MIDTMIALCAVMLLASTTSCMALTAWLLGRLVAEAVDDIRVTGITWGWLVMLPVLTGVTVVAGWVTAVIWSGTAGVL